MNCENQISAIRDELKALKEVFARNASDLITYTYSTSFTFTKSGDVVTLTFISEDGTNNIASVGVEENEYCRRIPYNGGARWYIVPMARLGESTPYTRTVVVRSMRKGRLVIT